MSYFRASRDLGDVVVGDRAEQFVDELRMVVEIHHQTLHSPQRPGPLVEREADLEDAEAVGKAADLARECRQRTAGPAGRGSR